MGRSRVPDEFAGRVGEWLKPADCKSAAPCGLRRFESSPVHQYRETRFVVVLLGCLLLAGKTGSGLAIARAWVAQLVERVLGKDEVTGSIPVPGSRFLAGGELEKAGVTQW
jgi:hypothetical protein